MRVVCASDARAMARLRGAALLPTALLLLVSGSHVPWAAAEFSSTTGDCAQPGGTPAEHIDLDDREKVLQMFQKEATFAANDCEQACVDHGPERCTAFEYQSIVAKGIYNKCELFTGEVAGVVPDTKAWLAEKAQYPLDWGAYQGNSKGRFAPASGTAAVVPAAPRTLVHRPSEPRPGGRPNAP